MRDRGARDVECAAEVGVHELVPVLVRRALERYGSRVHARAVEDEVQGAEFRDGVFYEFFYFGG